FTQSHQVADSTWLLGFGSDGKICNRLILNTLLALGSIFFCEALLPEVDGPAPPARPGSRPQRSATKVSPKPRFYWSKSLKQNGKVELGSYPSKVYKKSPF
ncbi:MAG TPA: hypothetical protein VMP68_17785, partial [Candidatus Eisenbacteria bacterium]|nr:hypothetical protein [Candidatus Eisenbacteria bacterium]